MPTPLLHEPLDCRQTDEESRTTPPSGKSGKAAFDFTCRHYLKLSGEEFLKRYDAGEFSGSSLPTPVKRVLSMLPFVR